MINGHGDDLYRYDGKIIYNFSSNIYGRFNHYSLKRFLEGKIDCITSYPEPSPYTLELELSRYLGVSEANVIVTAGATDAIYRIADLFRGKKSYIENHTTFSEYKDACMMSDHELIQNIHDAEVVWICNPNNPTGCVVPKTRLIESFRENQDKLFIVDQSYSSYTDKPVLTAAEICDFGNVLMIGSFTKRFGVPGLRLGYVIGDTMSISRLRSNTRPWAVSQLGIEAGKYLLSNVSSYKLPLKELLAEAKRVSQKLAEYGIKIQSGSTPFFVGELPSGKSIDLKNFLIDRFGILIRDASTFDGLSSRHFRISVQTPEENDILINAIGQWIML